MDLSQEFNPYPKKFTAPKKPKEIKKTRKPTGELKLFKEIFLERKGICEITGENIEFHPISFLHVLSKGAYPKFRLKKENILMVIPDVHNLYDNSSEEYLVSKYPKAKMIYEMKDELRTEYHKPKPTI